MDSCGGKEAEIESVSPGASKKILTKGQESWDEQLSETSPRPTDYILDASYLYYIHFMEEQLDFS